MLTRAEKSGLLVIDVQENATPRMSDPRRVIQGCGLLMRAAARLGIPLMASQQRADGRDVVAADPLMVDLRPWLPAAGAFAKTSFSCAGDPALLDHLLAQNRPQWVLAGIETHVAVLQTALDLKERGLQVFVVVDASAAKKPASEDMAWFRLRQSGIGLVSLEMVVFEWLRHSGTAEFKELTALL